jgi:D-tyrosyl-tRNA(Tyr) deacylase
VSRAQVDVSSATVGSIGGGWLALVGCESGDSEQDAAWLADRIGGLRGFSDEQGKMNLSAVETGASVLVVSQFTIVANLHKGRRPSFEHALEPVAAKSLCERVGEGLREQGLRVATGQFGATMQICLVNDGPVTFVLDSRRR